MTVRKPKKEKPQRLFVHPEVEPIIWAGGVIGPGQPLPKGVPAETVREWWHAHLIIGERTYRLYFSVPWNKNFPKDQTPPGVDVEFETGDRMTDGVREV